MSQADPPRERRRPGSSDRVALDVGGTRFVASASTLAANSAYFASLLSGDWLASTGEGGEGIFLDQDPVAFGTLLAYMRRGIIKVADIDTDVLALAEFLGVERLLLDAKVRWYCNIGQGPVLGRHEEIAAAFDQRYGGILKAIIDGLFPLFLQQDDVNAERDTARLIMSFDLERVRDVANPGMMPLVSISKKVDGNGNSEKDICLGDKLLGALNGLYQLGYKMHTEREATTVPTVSNISFSVPFSRRRHSAARHASSIFILSELEYERQKVKQFALRYEGSQWSRRRHGRRVHQGETEILAPAEFGDDEDDLYAEAAVSDDDVDLWRHRHNFLTREKEIAGNPLFVHYFQQFKNGALFSRRITVRCRGADCEARSH